MTLSLSRRAECVMQSEIRNMSIECERVGGLNLSQGVCDTGVPEPVREAAQKAIDDGVNSYTRYDGLRVLREAIARKVQRFYGVEVDPERNVTVTSGATGAFYSACLALLEPGDEVLLFEPFYGYHVSTLRAVEAVPTYVRMQAPDWTFTPGDLERAATPRTRGIMLSAPANPTGKVFSAEELRWVADFARRHDLFVFTDEIYEHFVFDDRTYTSPLTLPDLRDRTIAISGLSKTFSITGWRIGYAVADERWSKTLGYFSDLVYVCAPAPLQAGVARGLDALPAEFYDGLSREYQSKRDQICASLQAAGLTPYSPQGAYYVMADLSAIPGPSSKERAMRLLQATGVACVPGQAFFHDDGGERLARFCFAKKDAVLDEACRRIEAHRW
jgi:aminotransferase